LPVFAVTRRDAHANRFGSDSRDSDREPVADDAIQRRNPKKFFDAVLGRIERDLDVVGSAFARRRARHDDVEAYASHMQESRISQGFFAFTKSRR
jgi:hypothetical protein